MSDKRKAIVVLGMHRSGTSALTRVINLMGFSLPTHLMPSVDENNETGFWESTELAEIHDRLLDDVGSSWDDCLKFPSSFYGSPIAKTYSREILLSLEGEFPSGSDVVIKDPRICRFLPFWLEILEELEADPFCVLISRHPLEVADSLGRRDQFLEARSLHLWLRHMLDMEGDSRQLPRSLVTYDALLRDPLATIQGVATDLGITWSRDLQEVTPEINDFLSDALRHHQHDEIAIPSDPPLYRWALEVFAAFSTPRPHLGSLQETFDRVTHDLDAAEEVFSPALAAVQKSLHSTDRLHKTALEKSHAKDREIYEDEIRKNRQLLDEFDAKIRGMQTLMDEMRSSQDTDREKYELEIHAIRSALEESDAKVYTLGNALTRTTRDKDWVWERWQETRNELEAIQTSKVGRLLWDQWSLYLGLRRRIMRVSKIRHRQPSDPSGGGLSGLLRAGIRWPLRVIGRVAGLVYLSIAVPSEYIAARARQWSRKSIDDRPRSASLNSWNTLPRVLLVSPYPIYPPDHGGGVRLFNLVQRLAEDSQLHLLLFSQEGEDPEQREILSSWARSVHFHHWRPKSRPGGLHLQPPNANLFASTTAAREIAHLLASEGIDILQLEYAELGQYGLPEFSRVKVVLTEHDLAFRQHWRRRRMGFHHRFPEGNAYGASVGDWLRLTRYELAVCRRADHIHVMSETDGQSLSAFMTDGWDRLRVVPNAVDTRFYAPDADTRRNREVLYVGNFQNLPNVDALEFLIGEIWPAVRAEFPDLRLKVVGAHPSPRVTRFHGQEGIDVVGPVPDLRTYYHRHLMMVAPIRAGSGTRLKILEAFAAGLPVVSTSLGAEGLEANHDEHLLLADNAQSFAQAIQSLLKDDALCQRLSRSAIELARKQYDWQHSADLTLQSWHDLMESTGDSARGPNGNSPMHQQPARKLVDSSDEDTEPEVDVSIIIPTFHGGEDLDHCLEAISRQKTDLSYEVVCVDSGSDATDATTQHIRGARVIAIDPDDFDHGLTRDLGAKHSKGRILVFLNQDATPADEFWLERLTLPLFESDHCAAVQGGIRELPDPNDRFFWDSCGDRFYFTRESKRWIERYFGIGFSTVNAAIRRSIWNRYPFDAAPIMEDKQWQKRVVADGHIIRVAEQAVVTHTHNYDLRPLWRRCSSEGFGWRLVGEKYSLTDMVRDSLQLRVHKDLIQGLVRGRVRTSAEFLFPWLRPFALYWGNHWSRGVKL